LPWGHQRDMLGRKQLIIDSVNDAFWCNDLYMKQCKDCNEIKPMDDFYYHEPSKDKRNCRCKICFSLYYKQLRKTPEKKAKDAAYREQNKERKREYAKIYSKENKEKKAIYRREYRKRPQVKAKRQASKRIYRLLNREYTNSQLTGCSFQELTSHIESQFTEGMSWDNYGFYGWHIDHIRPCVSFDLTDPEQQKACFHYSNLQPLWAKDNLVKGGKFTPPDAPTPE